MYVLYHRREKVQKIQVQGSGRQSIRLSFLLLSHLQTLKKPEPEVPAESSCGAEDRNRTGTNLTIRGILSPLRLPVPPPRQKVEATPRIELGIKVLQTSALPLGYVALTGAENEIRTRDPLLGKEVLYH